MFINKVFKLGLILVSLVGWLNTSYADRYLVTIKSDQVYKQIKQLPTNPGQTNFGFLSASTKIDKNLDHLNMFIITSDEDLSALESHPEVLSVEKEVLFPLPKQISTFSSSVQSTDDTNAEVIERPWGIEAVNAPRAWYTSQGHGATVLVIDTGLDKDHPALSDQLIEGRSFYGRTDNVPYEYFDSIGHGTHVAGTVLADGLASGLEGVAPRAKLYAARVCAQLGCSPLAIAEAVNWGIELKVSVMNLSLGGPRISPSERLAFQKAEEAGISVVAASGNDGTGSISFPARIGTVIAVGAINKDLSKAEFSQYGEGLFIMAPGVDVNSAVPLGTGRQAETKINLGEGLEVVASNSFQGSSALDNIVEGDLVYVGLGKKENYEGVDLTDKIALIQRGEITFKDKVEGAMAVGAKAAVIFNNVDGLTGGAVTSDGSEIGIPVVMIEQNLGEQILTVIDNKKMSPEASILIKKTDYGSQQGTSMASPHVAGVVALIKSANPNLTPAQVRDIIKETATDLGSKEENGHGLVDAEKAVMKAYTMLGEMALAAN